MNDHWENGGNLLLTKSHTFCLFIIGIDIFDIDSKILFCQQFQPVLHIVKLSISAYLDLYHNHPLLFSIFQTLFCFFPNLPILLLDPSQLLPEKINRPSF